MMFFNKRKVKQKNKVRLSDLDSIVIQAGGKHFELFPRNQSVKYRNVISPGDGGMIFPDEYFCEKKATISQEDMNQISSLLSQIISSRLLVEDLDLLPPGATHDAYMRISYSGNTVYYTNTYTTEDGFRVKTEPVAVEFAKLIQLLRQYC